MILLLLPILQREEKASDRNLWGYIDETLVEMDPASQQIW